jgi:hypothetical protein
MHAPKIVVVGVAGAKGLEAVAGRAPPRRQHLHIVRRRVRPQEPKVGHARRKIRAAARLGADRGKMDEKEKKN